MNKLFCIASGQLVVKKADHQINRRNRYLNYGLLSLATCLCHDGWNPIQVQGNFDNPSITLKMCIAYGLDNSLAPMLISVPSFYAISWVNEFIQLVKSWRPETKIIIGGRWVVDGQVGLMTKLVPQSDLIISGLADHSICKIVRQFVSPRNDSNAHIGAEHNLVPRLNYSLLAERHLYQPSIEISRGCGMGCSFCQERNENRLPLKEPRSIVLEAEDVILQDELTEMHPYFEASNFIPNSTWIDDLILSRENCGTYFQWRTEGRADSISPEHIKKLKDTGLKVIDIGLESASPTQLIRMNKSRNPKKYLQKASDLLRAASEADIAVKINLLLTAGESLESIEETTTWLDQHNSFITGVSVGPVIIYGWPSCTKKYRDNLLQYGTTVSHSPVHGIMHLNLSSEIDYERSMKISNEIGRRYMTAEDYFFLKSFSYYSRDYKYDDFISDILEFEHDYSFDISCIIKQLESVV
jgi:radical SAM superfamily enzyme YgiQ (UPF0313 family)